MTQHKRLLVVPMTKISNVISLDLQAKKSRLNLSFKYLE